MTVDPYSIPNHAPPLSDFHAQLAAPDTSHVVPVRTIGDALDQPYVIGGSVFDEETGTLRGYIIDTNSGELTVECEHDLTHPDLVAPHQNTDWAMVAGPEDNLSHGMFFYGDDIEIARDVENTVFKSLSELYTDGFVPPFGSNHKEPDENTQYVDPQSCDHLQQGASLDIGNTDAQIIMCQRCEEFHAVQYDGDLRPRDALYDADCFMESLPTDRSAITNIDDETFVLHLAPASPTYESINELSRADMTGLLLTRNAALGTTNQIGMYTPGSHGLHILIKNNEAIGVLLSTDGGNDPQILVLALRADFRGSGNAQLLAEAWIDHAVSGDRYELYDPNEDGIRVFDRMGDYNPDPDTHIDPVDAVVTLELQRLDLSLDQFSTLATI